MHKCVVECTGFYVNREVVNNMIEGGCCRLIGGSQPIVDVVLNDDSILIRGEWRLKDM